MTIYLTPCPARRDSHLLILATIVGVAPGPGPLELHAVGDLGDAVASVPVEPVTAESAAPDDVRSDERG